MHIRSTAFQAAHTNACENQQDITTQDIVRSWCQSHQNDEDAEDYIKARDKILNFLNSSLEDSIDLENLHIGSLPDIFDRLEVQDKLTFLDISNSSITHLPVNFNPPKLAKLYLNHATITHLPENFNPPNLTYFDISNSSITHLPENFNPPKLAKLYLNRAPITHLPENFNPSNLETLNLIETQIAHLPENFNPLNLEELYLNHAPITHLPENFNPSNLKTLSLTETQITHLPENFNPLNLEELYLNRAPITHLPENFNPPNLTYFDICNSSITHLPENFNPLNLEQLYLNRAPITHLPENFNPSNLKTLSLTETQITHLPENFNPPKLEILLLNDTPITHLPENLNFPLLETLDLQDTAITSLPEFIFSLPEDCTIHLTLPNFSNHVRENLRQRTQSPNYDGPDFVYNMGTIETDKYLHLSLEKVFELVLKKAEKNTPETRSLLQILSHDKTEKQKNNLKIWLARLSETASASSENSKKFFKDVVSVLKHAAESEEMNSIFYSVLETATKTCGDRVALSVLHFDIQKQLAHLDVSRPKEVYTFLVNCVYVMDFLEKRAMNIVPTLPFTDPLEVFLGLPIVLKDEFSIPINLGEMLYFNCSGLNKDHIDTAKADLQNKLKDEDKLFGFLIEQPKWTDVLKAIYPEEFKNAKNKRDKDAADPVLATTALDKYNTTLKSLTKKAK